MTLTDKVGLLVMVGGSLVILIGIAVHVIENNRENRHQRLVDAALVRMRQHR